MTSNSNDYAYYSFPPTPSRTSPSSSACRRCSQHSIRDQLPKTPTPRKDRKTPAQPQPSQERPSRQRIPLRDAMAPSPAAGKQTPAAPKTPTKISRRPQGQTPQSQRPTQASSSARKPIPPSSSAASKAPAPKPEPEVSSEPGLEETDDDGEDAAGEASKGIEMRDDGEGDAGDDDDDVPLSKVTAAKSEAQEGLESADSEPLADDDDDHGEDQPVEKLKQEVDETTNEAEDDAEDGGDDATKEVGGTTEPADDTIEDQEQQDQPNGKKLGGLLSGAQSLAGKAGGLAGKNTKDPGSAASEAPKAAKQGVEETSNGAQETANDAQEATQEAGHDAQQTAEDGAEETQKAAGDVADEGDQAGEAAEDGVAEPNGVGHQAQGESGDVAEGHLDENEAAGDTADEADDAGEAVDGVKEDAADTTGQEAPQKPEDLPIDLSVLDGLEVNEDGFVYDAEGNCIGKLSEGDAEDLAGYPINHEGEILDDDGDLVGRVELLPDTIKKQLRERQEQGHELPDEAEQYLGPLDHDGGDVQEDDAEEDAEDDAGNLPSLSILNGLTCQVDGLIYDDEGNTIGKVVEGEAEELQHAVINEKGEFIDNDGNVVGRAEVHEDTEALVEQGIYEARSIAADEANEQDEAKEQVDEAADEAEDAADATADTTADATAAAADGGEKDAEKGAESELPEIEDQLPGIEALQGKDITEAGEIHDEEGNVLGGIEDAELKQKIADGEVDPTSLQIDEQGQITDAEGNVLGQAELSKEAVGDIPTLDFRILDGKKINKSGKILNDDGEEIGELTDGELKTCTGKKVNDKGEVLDKAGSIIGHVRVVPGEAAEQATHELLEELGELPEEAEEQIGDEAQEDLDEAQEDIGDAQEDVEEAHVDVDEAQEDVDEAHVDVDEAQEDVGEEQVDVDGVQEDADAAQEDVDEAQENIDEAQEELMEEPSLSILDGLKVNKKGQVLDEDGEPIGELTAGELSECAGKKINATGEVLDKDGNVIGHVRTLPQQAETPAVSILDGLKVNKNGQVLNEDGERIGELTSGDISHCAGKKINNRGEVLDGAGNVIGSVRTLPTSGEEETVEEEQAEEEVPEAEQAEEEVPEGGEAEEETPEEEQAEAEAAGEEGPQLPPLSDLEGLKVNKSGKLINSDGMIVGELVEGDAKKLSKSGITADAEGQFWDNKGHVVGRAHTVAREDPEEEAPFAGLEGLRVVDDGWVQDEEGNTVGYVTEGDAKKLIGRAVDEDGDILDKKGSVVGHADRYEPEDAPEVAPVDLSFLQGKTVTKTGLVIGDNGVPVARLVDGNAKELAGKQLDDQGQFWNDKGKVIGRVELIPDEEREQKPEGPFAGLDDLRVIEGGKVADEDGNVVGEITDGNPKRLIGLAVDEDGDIIDKYGNVKGHAEPLPDEPDVDYSILEGLTLNKQGFLVDGDGVPFGRLVEGVASELAGRQCDENGYIYNDKGKVVGRCEPIPENERVARAEGPFAGLQGLRVVKDGKVEDEDENVVGEVVDGNPKKLVGLAVDEDGDIIDKFGNTKGHAERIEEEDEQPLDNSALEGKTLNKQGYVVDEQGIPFGRLIEGNVSELAGRKCDENGFIHGDTGKVVGKCEILPENERVARPEGPFAGLDGLRVVKEGYVEDADGNVVGQIVEGDPKRMIGLHVDEDGDIIDKYGNVKGHAEPWSEEEAAATDLSRLSGTKINKAGYAVDGSGQVIGRVVEGDPKIMIGKKVDGEGQIWDDSGNVIGRCELITGVGDPEGPFAGFEGLQINKDGTITTPAGDIVGRIVEGDIKKLLGHTVDEDGDINDKNGNTIGKAERWEPDEKERRANPMSGKRVNKEGEVRDENGDLMGRLTMGDLGHCVGQEIDDAGNVVDIDGNKIGEVTLIENIAEDEFVGPTEEELAEAAQREDEREIAEKMGTICSETLERMQPICKQITELMEKADRTPKDELDEDELVNQVKPLIEEGGRILQECNGSLRGLDPDGKIAAQAKGRAGAGEATPEEYRLAETLKELTTTVVTTIDNAKKKLNDMPHAKKKLNPLWGLLTQPLFQILAAVGMLLAGVLGLVGQLLNGLGLGGLVNGLLGGLGINKLLESFGLVDGSKKGKGGRGKGGKSALSSLPIVGGFLGGNK